MAVATPQKQGEFGSVSGWNGPDWASKRGEILGLTVDKCFVFLVEGGRGGVVRETRQDIGGSLPSRVIAVIGKSKVDLDRLGDPKKPWVTQWKSLGDPVENIG